MTNLYLDNRSAIIKAIAQITPRAIITHDKLNALDIRVPFYYLRRVKELKPYFPVSTKVDIATLSFSEHFTLDHIKWIQ